MFWRRLLWVGMSYCLLRTLSARLAFIHAWEDLIHSLCLRRVARIRWPSILRFLTLTVIVWAARGVSVSTPALPLHTRVDSRLLLLRGISSSQGQGSPAALEDVLRFVVGKWGGVYCGCWLLLMIIEWVKLASLPIVTPISYSSSWVSLLSLRMTPTHLRRRDSRLVENEESEDACAVWVR